MFRKVLPIFYGSIFVFLISAGCAEDQRSNSSSNSNHQNSSTAPLVLAQNDGEDTVTLPTPNIQSTFFGKKYDRALYEAILKKRTAKGMISLLRKVDIEVFGVSSRAEELAPAPPRLLMDYWNTCVDKTKKTGALAGLAVFEGYQSGGETYGHDAILVSDPLDLKFLVHEFTHHLFNRERRKTDEPSPYDVRDNIQTKAKAMSGKFDAFVDREEGFFESHSQFVHDKQALFEDFLSTLQDLAQDARQVIQMKFAEEAASEYLLLIEYRDGDFQLTKDEVLESLSYADTNIKEAFELLESLELALSGARKVMQSPEIQGSESVSRRVREITDMFLGTQSEMTTFSDAFKSNFSQNQRFRDRLNNRH
ncbi:MAG: hypothetical protein AB1540_02460 [Bdellovibrionota bacterium]